MSLNLSFCSINLCRNEITKLTSFLNSLEAINSYLVSRLNQININLRSQLESAWKQLNISLHWNVALATGNGQRATGNWVAYSQLDAEVEGGTG